MKKCIALFLSLALLAACVTLFAACGDKEYPIETPDVSEDVLDETETPADGMIDGGWANGTSPEITDAFRAVFDKAAANVDGVSYTPVAYLSSQVVAGRNHRVLCKATPVVPDATPTYAILTIYEDLSGNAEITEVLDCKAETGIPGLAGGWNEPDSPAVTEEAQTALTKACETLTGAAYTPVALLATQVVAGRNYRLLCESKATVPGAQTEYVIVIVYADLQGNAEITDTFPFGDEADEPAAEAETDVSEAPPAVGISAD